MAAVGLWLRRYARFGAVFGEDGGHREFAGVGVVNATPALNPRGRDMDKARVFGHEVRKAGRRLSRGGVLLSKTKAISMMFTGCFIDRMRSTGAGLALAGRS